jgi:alkanesulfonate monooxygenase
MAARRRGLVGSYDEVAARIGAFHAAGIELFMLQFQPFEVEMKRFAEEVIPRVRRARTGSSASSAPPPERRALS